MTLDKNERRAAELILYISQRYADDPNFGQTKLNKALFFPDFTAYGSWGTTISGAQYQNNTDGPTLIGLPQLLKAMQETGDVAIQVVKSFGYPQKRVINLRDPDLTLFTAREISLVDMWLEKLRPMTGKQASDFSHKTAAWKYTTSGEIIDPKFVYIGGGEPTAADIRRGKAIAARYGLLA